MRRAVSRRACVVRRWEQFKPSSAAAENLNPKGYDFGGETVTIASTYIKLADMVPGKNNDTDRLLDRISEVEQAFHVNVEFKEVDQGTYWDNMATTNHGRDPVRRRDGRGAVVHRRLDPCGRSRRYKRAEPGKWGLIFTMAPGARLRWPTQTYGSAIYGFSRERDAVQVMCLYNRKLFRAAGLTDPNELIDQGKSGILPRSRIMRGSW